MSILIAYLEGDRTKRVHITDYDEKIHKGKLKCADGHNVIAKKGMKVIWHYSHVSGQACSATREMGYWHHWWQDRVETEFLEVRMKRDDKLHIADMQNGDDTVIEFQKSVISPEIIAERESFYEDMMWIFCCSNLYVKEVRQCGRFLKLKVLEGSKFFLHAKRRSFLDFDKRGVLELMECVDPGKSRTFLYVKIWTMAEFDAKFMRGCLKESAHSRIDRPPYKFDDKEVLEFEEARKILNAKKF